MICVNVLIMRYNVFGLCVRWRLKTNKYGIANIPVKNSGLQIIAAVYYADEISDNNVNKITIQSSISFEVK